MNNILELLNNPLLYLISGIIICTVIVFSLILFVKSYRAGIAIGMDKKRLLRSITASATFTVLPSVSILLGVIALSGSLGMPLPWLRLSVIGALHYETSVADIAARSMGMSGLNVAEMTPEAFSTIALVMSVGIIWGMVGSIFFLKKYLSIVSKKNKNNDTNKEGKKGRGLGDVMMAAMFIGLISAYLGSYVGTFTSMGDIYPLLTGMFAAIAMGIFESIQKKFNVQWLENFSLAASMLIAMTLVVVVGIVV